jgi:hypothetical protein
MTQSHVLPAGKCSVSSMSQPVLLPLVYASQVSVGDCVMTESGQERVHTVGRVWGEGVYTIVANQVNRVYLPIFLSCTSLHLSLSYSCRFISYVNLYSHSHHLTGIFGSERHHRLPLRCQPHDGQPVLQHPPPGVRLSTEATELPMAEQSERGESIFCCT